MKIDPDKFKKAREISMTNEEKTAIKGRVLTYLVRNPIPARRYLWSNVFLTNNFKLKPMPIIIALVLLLSGGTSLAAQSSLPGDTLYPVKIEVNEKVRGWFALDEEARVRFETSLAERRLDEAEKLAAKAELNGVVRAKIEQNFDKFADRVEARIEKLEESNPEKAAELSANFETALKAHAQILESIGASVDGKIAPEVKVMLKIIEDRQKMFSDNREENEAKIESSLGVDAQAAAQGRLNSAQNKVDEVRKFISSHSVDISAEVKAKAEARLAEAIGILADAKAKLNAKLYKESFILSQKAHHLAQEAKLLLNAKIMFENRDENLDKDNGPSPSPSVTSSIEAEADSNAEVNGGQGSTKSEVKIEIKF